MANPSLKDIATRLDRLESLLGRIPGGGVADPGPDPWGGGGWWTRPPRWPIPIPFPGDPAPFDLSRFNKAQLAVTKEMLKTERFRLDSLERLIDDQIKAAGK